MSSIRSILENYAYKAMNEFDDNHEIIISTDQATKEIEKAIKNEIIGEDEKDEAGWNEQIRNGLRTEQKSNLKELFK